MADAEADTPAWWRARQDVIAGVRDSLRSRPLAGMLGAWVDVTLGNHAQVAAALQGVLSAPPQPAAARLPSPSDCDGGGAASGGAPPQETPEAVSSAPAAPRASASFARGVLPHERSDEVGEDSAALLPLAAPLNPARTFPLTPPIGASAVRQPPPPPPLSARPREEAKNDSTAVATAVVSPAAGRGLSAPPSAAAAAATSAALRGVASPPPPPSGSSPRKAAPPPARVAAAASAARRLLRNGNSVVGDIVDAVRAGGRGGAVLARISLFSLHPARSTRARPPLLR